MLSYHRSLAFFPGTGLLPPMTDIKIQKPVPPFEFSLKFLSLELCKTWLFFFIMQNLDFDLYRIRLFPLKMHNLLPSLCRIWLFPLKMQNLRPGLCRIRLFPLKMHNPYRSSYRNRLYVNNSAMHLLACSQWTRSIGLPLYENPGKKSLIKTILQHLFLSESTHFRTNITIQIQNPHIPSDFMQT